MRIEKTAMIFATTAYMIEKFNKPNIELLQKMGYKVHIAANFKEPGPMSTKSVREFKLYLKKMDVEFYDLPIPRNPINFISMTKSYIKLREIMENTRFDLIHSHSPTGGVIGRLVAKKYRKRGLKSIYTAHGFHFYKGAPLKMWLLFYPVEKIMSKYTDILITINKEDYNLAVNKMYAENNKYIPGVGVDTKKFSPINKEKKKNLRKKMGFDSKDYILIYVGELSYRKNQLMLINSIPLIRKSIKDIKVLLVGQGPKEHKLKEVVESLNIADCVEFLGYRTDIPELMAISDLSVSTSRQEGLPVNVMEAMACGIPLVVTDCRGNSDLVNDNENGFVVDIDNINMFVEAVKKMTDSDSNSFSKNSVLLSRKYSVDSILEHYFEIYEIN